MKIAFPILLVGITVVLVTVFMMPNSGKVRTYADSQADRDIIERAKQQLLDKSPALKVEDADLNSKYELADKAVRDAKHTEYDARSALAQHDREIRDELVKNDPSLNAVYDRLAFDKRVPLEWGDQKLFVNYGEAFHWDGIFSIFFYVFPVAALMVGIFLLLRPPSLAGAHQFLIFLTIPLILLGPLMFRFAVGVYLMRFDELDRAPTPYMFEEANRALVRAYFFFLPSLLIYVALLLRIFFREKRGQPPAER